MLVRTFGTRNVFHRERELNQIYIYIYIYIYYYKKLKLVEFYDLHNPIAPAINCLLVLLLHKGQVFLIPK
jgi:hypothetical protein